MRAIDADATIKEIKARNPDDVSYEDAWAITCIEHAPTIEPDRNEMVVIFDYCEHALHVKRLVRQKEGEQE